MDLSIIPPDIVIVRVCMIFGFSVICKMSLLDRHAILTN